ncbi:MAG: universal stress protein [Polyangiaceae bacterium]
MATNRILVAVDGSTREVDVFDTAVDLAQRYDGTLYVVRAITVSPEFPAAAAGTSFDPLPAYLTQDAIAALRELWKRAPHLRATAPIVVVGQPSRVILDVAKEFEVDLIIMGSHGYRGWDRLLGTTAGTVANQADRNVLVVHRPAAGNPGLPQSIA